MLKSVKRGVVCIYSIYICLNKLKHIAMKLKAKIQTKSNYRNLNGTFVIIVEFLGDIVVCQFQDENGKEVKADFGISEIKEIRPI